MVIDAKTFAIGGWFVAIWLLETWLPYYEQFPASIREKLRHDGRNLLMGIVNAVITAALFGFLIPVVASCRSGPGFGML